MLAQLANLDDSPYSSGVADDGLPGGVTEAKGAEANTSSTPKPLIPKPMKPSTLPKAKAKSGDEEAAPAAAPRAYSPNAEDEEPEGNIPIPSAKPYK